MGRKRLPGLIMRAGTWHIDKHICGRRVCQSTGSSRLEEAERYLARMMEEARQAQIYGVRPSRTFEQAAAKFVLEHQHKRSLADDICRLRGLMPWIGRFALDRIHMGTLEPWVEQRRQRGAAQGTINHGLQIVRRNLEFGCCRMGGREGPDLASDAGKDQASAGQATASALPAELGGAGSPVSRSAAPLGRNGTVCR